MRRKREREREREGKKRAETVCYCFHNLIPLRCMGLISDATGGWRELQQRTTLVCSNKRDALSLSLVFSLLLLLLLRCSSAAPALSPLSCSLPPLPRTSTAARRKCTIAAASGKKLQMVKGRPRPSSFQQQESHHSQNRLLDVNLPVLDSLPNTACQVHGTHAHCQSPHCANALPAGGVNATHPAILFEPPHAPVQLFFPIYFAVILILISLAVTVSPASL